MSLSVQNKPIALVLSGGGIRGLAHAGAIKALVELGYNIKAISGTSSGAVVGALFVSGHDAETILEIVSSAKPLFRLRPIFNNGLFTMESFRKLFSKYLHIEDFSQLPIKLFVNATDLEKGETVYFQSGSLVDAVLAACCVPLLFSPFKYKNQYFIDGGILNNLPIEPIKTHFSNYFTIGSHCNPVNSNFLDFGSKQIIERSLLLAIQSNTLRNQSMVDFILEAEQLNCISGIGLSKGKEIFDIGYEYTIAISEKLEKQYKNYHQLRK